MNVKLSYGQEKLEVNIDERNLLYLVEGKPHKPLSDPRSSLFFSLSNPIGSPPLRDKVKGKKKICIVISDITRAVPTKLILEVLLSELESCGIAREQITILIATGLHRPNEGKELEILVGKEIAQKYRIINHNARDMESCKYIGNTKRGTPVILNRIYLNSDFKILTGLIEPHFMAGFSGGRKSVCPGISYMDMFRHFHGPQILESPNATNIILEGNPFHEESTEIARMAGVDFIVNVTIDKNKEITRVFSGDLEKAFYEGARFCRESSCYEIGEEADIVLTSGGGYPLDINLYQTVKGMVGAIPAVRQGGMIIIASRCPEGIGSEEFTELLIEEKDLEGFIEKISSPGFFKIDQWEFEELVKARKKAEIYLYSEGVGTSKYSHLIPSSTLKVVSSVDEAIEIGLKKYGSDARITVIPDGPYVIPIKGRI